ncbi:IS630 family transposase [Dankookia rubra]|uniref:IS630 family transposase n=1 Tax=Dankookia rubra TaxID=1442381 RepID=A0A4R5Q732_9PROT|nr:IS630 family transposase [Dankookia rubra]
MPRSCATSWPSRTTRPSRSTRRGWPSGRAAGASTRARSAGRCCGSVCCAKKTLHASEQDRPDVAAARDAWRGKMLAGADPRQLVFLDESGIDTRMTRSHAQAPRGKRAIGRVPGGHCRRLTILGAIAPDGMVAAMTVAAATSTAVLVAFVEQVLAPALKARPGAVLVMDNLAPHKAAAARRALDQAGLKRRYLPPHSPDLNPIEQAWAKMKERLRQAGARSIETLDNAVPDALSAITPDDASAWFRHCGYRSA